LEGKLAERGQVEDSLCPKSISMFPIGVPNQKRVCERGWMGDASKRDLLRATLFFTLKAF